MLESRLREAKAEAGFGFLPMSDIQAFLALILSHASGVGLQQTTLAPDSDKIYYKIYCMCSWPSELCGHLGLFLSIQVMASRLPRDLHGAGTCHPLGGIRPSYLDQKHFNLSYLDPPSFVQKLTPLPPS